MEVHRKDGDIENRPVSKGGKWFDGITYFGIAGIGTFLATIPTGAMFMEGGKLHGAFNKVNQGLRNIGFSKRLAGHGANTFATFWGGTLMLLPVGLMEHNRTKIVTALNRLFKDPTDPKSVEDAPPQTAGSIVKARAVATATVFTGFVGVETIVGEQRFARGLEHAGEKLHRMFNKTATMIDKTHWSYKFGRTGALDVLATASSALMLYVGSHFFSKRAYERRVTKEYMEQKRADAANDTPTASAESPAPLATDKPSAQISQVQRDQSIATAPAQPQLHA